MNPDGADNSENDGDLEEERQLRALANAQANGKFWKVSSLNTMSVRKRKTASPKRAVSNGEEVIESAFLA